MPATKLIPSGFFVLRTPLLAFDVFQAWTEHAELTEYLRTTWRQPAVREAVFLASPELDAALERTDRQTDEPAQKALRSFVAYFARMCARATPFGLFAGCSVGVLGQTTALDLPPIETQRRHTRLDMDYLSALTVALETDPAVRSTLRYAPNSSLYPAAGRLHYVESRLAKSGRSYHLVAVDESPELVATLRNASVGATLDQLAAGLVDHDTSPDDARAFIDELAESQVLVSELALSVTGAEPIYGLIDQLAQSEHTQPVAATLEDVRAALAAVDGSGTGGNLRATYAAIKSQLEVLPTTPDLARLFQVDLVKRAPGLTLGPSVLGEITRGLTILQRLSQPRPDGLEDFRRQFMERYEGAEMPLVEVLDEEVGIGFAAPDEPGGEPLLHGLDLPPPLPESAAWRPQDLMLLRLLYAALERGDQEMTLDSADIDALAAPQADVILPDAMAVIARLAAPSASAVDRGDYRLLLQAATGPSGARLLGRFCHADPELQRCVEAHLRAEEAQRPGAIFAEIVHLPEGRIGNILCRPVLRDYEIPFLGRSGAAANRRIPVTDLHVSLRGGRIVLRSARLDREIIPRLTTAHNFGLRSLGIYRFLCALQTQSVSPGLAWSWGRLERAPFLPRVVAGRLVLARASWNLGRSVVRAMSTELSRVRAEHRLPRYVVLGDADNELVVDFDNPISVGTFMQLVKVREEVHLVELFPPPEELCVAGPEGRFLHELIVPFIQHSASPPSIEARTVSNMLRSRPPGVLRRRFAPGSEWLYAKLYTGRGLADRLLVDVLGPLVDDVLATGLADAWFFVRYADPEPHLRVRFHGQPQRLTAELLPLLERTLAALLDDRRISRLQLDTYAREVERYGGDAGMSLAERFFYVDSDCVLAMLRGLPGDEGLAWRWKLGVCGVDLLLEALGFDLPAKRYWARVQRDAFASEFQADGRLKQQIGEVFRAERGDLFELLRLVRSPEADNYPAAVALNQRMQRLAPIAQALHAEALPVADLAASYAHMHLNRLLRSAHRFQELAIYDLLDRIYRGQIARSGA